MFEKSASSRFKRAARVTITLAGHESFDAFVFLTVNERLIDLLNDDRAFIPINKDGRRKHDRLENERRLHYRK